MIEMTRKLVVKCNFDDFCAFIIQQLLEWRIFDVTRKQQATVETTSTAATTAETANTAIEASFSDAL
ncbi:hypothetical protein EYY83_13025 [Hafnia alvei]|uniref:hypothetical protein n=1 Tax=Hafnia alvei TaxID=569 RepID=UPI001034C9E1|nr:hypothetical protein [Hafnia alvei]TBM13015.1 hypothetical protein EYY83_13025 [Hafnia alvei]